VLVVTLSIKNLTPHFGAEITDLDLTQEIDDETISDIKTALETYSVLVFREQRFDDQSQTAFSARFGPLEHTVYKPEGDGGNHVADITNVDFRTNQIYPKGHSRLKSNSGNEMWHTDSSFKPTPAYCSMLSGREVPPLGADTQFGSCRVAYDALPDAEKLRLEGLVAEHSYGYSRSLVAGYKPPEQTLQEVPPVRHAVIRSNPANGLKNFYTGSHASHIIGAPIEEGRQALRDLVESATQPNRVYVHNWRQFDFVIWDNRCVLHRGTPFDTANHRRVMRRTTVAGAGPTVNEAGEALAMA
jgi:alpha-ketoglutarate-dependent 2,4-dichlorophenoxyacetate dioxygenase